ncbi:copper chaperone PCu(A)C [Leeia oryzae]|uniref:copper chaperone PCu(A)C n=1 Tax=Leeia oryzae TaxID=356662 RepID=UPI0003776137|nr:copper chaperone PCu(A)C [Leeia oryzae]
MKLKHLALGISALSVMTFAGAHEFKAGNLVIQHPWARESMPNMNMGAFYFKIENTGNSADTLLAVDNADVADKMQLHTNLTENGIMKMRPVTDVVIAPKSTLEFKPQSYHVMVFGIKKPMKKGDSLPITLHFKNAGDVKVEVHVEAADAMH